MSYDYESLVPGYYDFSTPGPRSRWHKAKFSTVSRVIEDISPQILIDLGTGPGVFLRDYCKDVPLKIGYDVSLIQIAYANKFPNGGIRFVSDLSNISLGEKNESIKSSEMRICITAIELVEHISDKVFNEIHLKLNDVFRNQLKGVPKVSIWWIITSPNKNSLWPLLELGIDFALRTDYHIQHSNLETSSILSQRLSNILKVKVSRSTFMSFRQWLFTKPPLKTYKKLFFRGMLTLLVAEQHTRF